jgi:hypothetical protein
VMHKSDVLRVVEPIGELIGRSIGRSGSPIDLPMTSH